jgi:hypothetical protein
MPKNDLYSTLSRVFEMLTMLANSKNGCSNKELAVGVDESTARRTMLLLESFQIVENISDKRPQMWKLVSDNALLKEMGYIFDKHFLAASVDSMRDMLKGISQFSDGSINKVQSKLVYDQGIIRFINERPMELTKEKDRKSVV